MATNTLSRSLPRALKRAQWSTSAPTRRSVATAAAAAVDYHDPPPPPTRPSPTIAPSRRKTVREAKPFSDFLTDTHARQHDYLRISLSEKCNLRCLYCMPEEGIQLSPPATQLTTPEIIYLCQLFVSQGVNKIRLTGGEPTVRKDILELMRRIGGLRGQGLKELALTTNGISLWRKLDTMVEAGLTGVNISLDTLDPFQFQLLTRRQGFDAVMKSINRVQDMNKLGAGVKLKINCVVMRGLNDHQILPFIEMTREQDVEVRFIEYMPFGGNKWSENKMLPYAEMLELIQQQYPGFERLRDKRNDTSKTWQVPGFVGRVGFITSMTHNFCGTCNRLRITSDGNLKVCLHGEAEVSLRDLLRSDNNNDPMDDEAFEAIRRIELDKRKGSGLQFDGEEGWMSNETQLLETIGTAVKRKKAKHAGMGQLENMKNRPMILIGDHNHPQSLLRRRRRYSPSTSPWSQIPIHLLGNSSVSSSSSACRFFSSGTVRRSADDGKDGGSNDERSSLASTFGFQSLSGLFQEPPKGRYSRPRALEKEAEVAVPKADPSEARGGGRQVGEGFFRPSEAATPSSTDVQSSPTALTRLDARQELIPTASHPHTSVTDSNNDDDEPSTFRRYDALPLGKKVRMAEKQTAETKASGTPRRQRLLQSPRHMSDRQSASAMPREHVKTKAVNPRARVRENPWRAVAWGQGGEESGERATATQNGDGWGASKEDMATIDNMADPSTTATVAASVETEKAPPIASPSGRRDSAAPPGNHGAKLTHLTSSGEAHMVDVGAKQATRRVAVAFAQVCFSNPEPFRLIFEHNNKKGDVLGVARIAGIMAAKRTSDLIPLCHPIAISKVEFDATLLPPCSAYNHTLRRANKYGAVALQGLVETVGPTGVEMEAMTAVSAAGLTVYDMAKAVDKSMEIFSARVVFKIGGRSGLHLQDTWAKSMGERWFEDRGLEIPEAVRVGAAARALRTKESQ